MIRRFKMLFLAVVAVFALSVAAVAAVASAAEMVLPEFTNAAAVTGDSTSTEGKLVIEGGATLKSKSTTGKFTFNKESRRLGPFTLEFIEVLQGGELCLSLGGKTAGLVTVTGEWHLVLEEKEGKHLWLVAFLLPTEVHIECLKSAVKLLLVKGSAIVLITPAPNVLTKEFKVLASAPGGIQAEKTYENNKAEKVLDILEVSQEGGKAKKAGISTLAESSLKFLNAKGEVVENEIIN